MPSSVDYHDHLVRALRDPAEAQAYLNAALEQGDVEMFLVALRNVAEAQGTKRSAKGRSGPNALRSLSKKMSPRIEEVEAILSRLGLRLAVERRNAA